MNFNFLFTLANHVFFFVLLYKLFGTYLIPMLRLLLEQKQNQEIEHLQIYEKLLSDIDQKKVVAHKTDLSLKLYDEHLHNWLTHIEKQKIEKNIVVKKEFRSIRLIDEQHVKKILLQKAAHEQDLLNSFVNNFLVKKGIK